MYSSRQPSSIPNKEAILLASKEKEAFSIIDNNLSNYSKDIAINPNLLAILTL